MKKFCQFSISEPGLLICSQCQRPLKFAGEVSDVHRKCKAAEVMPSVTLRIQKQETPSEPPKKKPCKPCRAKAMRDKLKALKEAKSTE